MFQLIGIKRSGEALNVGAAPGQTWTEAGLKQTTDELRSLYEYITELNEGRADGVTAGAIVVIGAGNGRFRGDLIEGDGVGRPEADQIGLMGTILNAMVVAQKLREAGIPHELLMAEGITLGLPELAKLRACTPEVIQDCLERGVLGIVAGGSAKLRQTTDAAVLDHLARFRAATGSDVVAIKATKFDGVYNADPAKKSSAKLFTRISAREMLEHEWFAVDETCLGLIETTGIPIRVYGGKSSLSDAIVGKAGTLIVAEKIEHEYA